MNMKKAKRMKKMKKMKSNVVEIVKEVIACDVSPVAMFSGEDVSCVAMEQICNAPFLVLKLVVVLVAACFGGGDVGGFILVAAVMFQEGLEEEARTAVDSS